MNRLDLIELIIKYPYNGFDINETYEFDETILHAFLRDIENSYETMKFVLSLNTNLDINAKNADGETAFAMACKEGALDFALLLSIQPSIDLNTKDDEGMTPLLTAYQHQNLDIVHQLLKLDRIDVNACNNNGFTLLHLVCKRGDLKMISKLAKIPSIDVNARAKNGGTPLHIACKRQNKVLVKTLCQFLIGMDLIAEDKHGKEPTEYISKEGIEIGDILMNYALNKQ